MKIPGAARSPSSLGGALCLAVVAALLPARAPAADPVNLEGTWKISTPQSAFKPEGGSVPFTDIGRKRYAENKRNLAKRAYEEYDYATARCASPGLPRLMLTPERFRIWQRPGWVAVQFEWNRLARQIAMGDLTQPQVNIAGNSPGSSGDDALVGRAVPISQGHWEGDTLVVETEGFQNNTLIDNLVPHGYDLKTTERIRLKGTDALEDRITIEDPKYFTRPWQTVVTYRRQPDNPFPENVCLDTRVVDSGAPTP
jgi:hypothetical protein